MSESRYNESFYGTPYSLHQNPLWISATNDEKEVLRVLQYRAAICDMTYDNNGLSIALMRGQVCISLKQLSLEAHVSMKKVRQAINHFSGFDRKGKDLLQRCGTNDAILGTQERAQKRAPRKMVLSILLDGFYKNEGMIKGTEKGMDEGTNRAQTGHINKEAKKPKEVISLNAPGAVDSGALTRRFFALDEKTKTFIGMTSKDIEGWREHYRYLNPLDYFDEMATWILANKSAEYRANIPRKFFTNWLSKHNELNQKNIKKGQKNDNRSDVAQRQRNQNEGRYRNGIRDETPLVAGGTFYDDCFAMPKMQKK